MTSLEPCTDPPSAVPDQPRWGQTAADYLALTKPRIIELLLVTTFPTMFLPGRGLPSVWLIGSTLVGGTVSAAAANTLNCYLDRDIDSVMHRTKNRPLVTGAISPPAAVRFGVALTVISTLWLGLLVNWLSAALSLGAIVLYVGLYTMLLKRRTSQNIVWGRRCRLYAGPHRLVCRHQLACVAGVGALHDHLLVDAAALLAVVDAFQGRVRGRRGADAPRRDS